MNAAEVKQPSFDTLLLAIKNSSANLNANINSTHAEIQATRTDLITSSIHDTWTGLTSSIEAVSTKLDEINVATNARIDKLDAGI